MDMVFEAAPMVAGIEMVSATVRVQKVETFKAFALIARVASNPCPSISGHSISAVAPDHNFEGGTAKAAA